MDPQPLLTRCVQVAWDEIIFNDHMLQPVPEEGISRLVTQQTNERRDHYVRYGIALILEHGFMKTAKGQQSYQMNILQIRNATLETMYFGVIEVSFSRSLAALALSTKKPRTGPAQLQAVLPGVDPQVRHHGPQWGSPARLPRRRGGALHDCAEDGARLWYVLCARSGARRC